MVQSEHELILKYFHEKVIKLPDFKFVPWLVEKEDFKNKILTMVGKFENVTLMSLDESGYLGNVVKIKYPEGEARLREKKR